MEVICILLVVLFFVLLGIKNREHYSDLYGMNYINTHKYFKCCNQYGCNSSVCQNVLNTHKSNLQLYGYIEKDGKFYNLYKQLNQNTKNYKYFVKITNEEKDFYYKELDENKYRYLYNGDTVELDGINYTVNTYNQNNYYYGNSWLDKWNTPSRYINPYVSLNDYINSPIYNSDGYLFNKSIGNDHLYRGLSKIGIIENGTDSFKIVYSKPIGRNQWEYYVKLDDIYIGLDVEKNELYTGDAVSFNGSNYTFNNDL